MYQQGMDKQIEGVARSCEACSEIAPNSAAVQAPKTMEKSPC